MPNALETANIFLALSEPEVGDSITNLKIQKLLYYVQGFHLALYNKPLFDEDFVNWEHGPVIETLYHAFKEHGSEPLPVPENVTSDNFTDDQLELISEVNQVYGQFSAWKLRNLTHEEAPWLTTVRNQTIPKELLREYFLTRLQ